MRLSHKVFVFSSICALSLAGCGDDETPPGPAEEAGIEAGPDVFVDAGTADAPVTPTPDAAPEQDVSIDVADMDTMPMLEGGDVADTGIAPDAEASAPDADAGDAMVISDTGLDVSAGGAAFVRFAALSPDAVPVDFCVRARASAGEEEAPWLGPLAGQLGIATGLTYRQVTGYIPIPPESYDIRVIAASPTATCTTALSGTFNYGGVPRLEVNTHATVVLTGLATADAGRPLGMQAYEDDPSPTSGQAELRIIHVAPGQQNVNVGFGTGDSFVPITTYLAYLGFSRGGDFNHEGYLLSPPISGQTLSVRDTASQEQILLVPAFNLPANSVRTVFAVGLEGRLATPFQLLSCDDLSTGTTTTCVPIH